MRTIFCLLIAVVLGAVLTGCSTNPATGKTSFTLQSWDWERSIALEAGPQFTDEFGGATPDPTAQAYVKEIGSNLTRVALEQAYAEVPELPWEYTLLDSEVLNAFALPGGKVYISRGLAVLLANEAQLAGVLGHEVGHVMARHGNQRITKQLGFNLALAGLAVGVGLSDDNSTFRQVGEIAVPALAVGGNVVLLSYGRDEEMEADALGMQYMSSIGYDPSGQRQVMEILGRASAGGSRPPEWLSTHPTSETRIARINALLRDTYAHTQGSPEFVLDAPAYERRMLSRLRALPPAKQRIEQGLLEDPTQWCAVCREDVAAR